MSRRPRRRRPSPAEEPAAPAGREHRLFLPVLGRAQDSGPACPAVPHSRPPCAGRREDQPPREVACCRRSQGAVLLSAAPAFFLRASLPQTRVRLPRKQALVQSGEATRRQDWPQAWKLEAQMSRRSESVPGERSSFLRHTRAANKLCFPPCSTQATFGWKTGHLAMTGRPSSGEDGMHTLGAAVGRKVL